MKTQNRFAVSPTPYGSFRLYCSIFAPDYVRDYLKGNCLWGGHDSSHGNLIGYEFSDEAINEVKAFIQRSSLGMVYEENTVEFWEELANFSTVE